MLLGHSNLINNYYCHPDESQDLLKLSQDAPKSGSRIKSGMTESNFTTSYNLLTTNYLRNPLIRVAIENVMTKSYFFLIQIFTKLNIPSSKFIWYKSGQNQRLQTVIFKMIAD